MVFIRRKAHFHAAHRLHNPEKSDAWNKKTYGKCNNKHWHGHNYKIEVVIAGEPGEDTGYVIHLDALNAIVEEYITEKCDHKNLNLDVDFLQGVIPSIENLVKTFYEQLEEPIDEATGDSAFLYSVEVQETERNSAEYCPHLIKS